MRVQEPYFGKLAAFAGRKIYLVAATLRPETMYAFAQPHTCVGVTATSLTLCVLSP